MRDERETSTGNEKTVGFEIVSEGTVLQTVSFPSGFYVSKINDMSLNKIKSKIYISIRGKYVSDDAILTYLVDSSTSGVQLVRMDKRTSAATYDLGGRQTNGHKGVNIVRSENGETKKVFVK